jgi:hypothetical protein
MPSTSAGGSSAVPEIYAGVAFEVHTVAQDGSATIVDPTSHVFRTGDQFMLFYRPSMPGHITVTNINPNGASTLIDSLDVAGGALVKLGPYQFTDTPGDESLRLVLTPCTSGSLLATTRDIVKASDGGTASAVPLPSCPHDANLPTAAAHTRDIRKVQQDGTTSYALDQVSQQELASGQIDPRQLTISLHHQ